ncbi:hypothetical protein PMAYCL1PPCAC_11759, partial [Pristionchus mayeri]
SAAVAAAAVAAAAASSPNKADPIPIETVSSEDEVMVVDEPPQLKAAVPSASSSPLELNIQDVPKPVQLKLIQFNQMRLQHMKPGKKFVSQILLDKSIEIHELTGRLGMKKSMRNLVIEKMADMIGYTKAGLLQRINNATRSAASTSTAPALPLPTVPTPAPTTTPSQPQSLPSQSEQQTTTASASACSVTSTSTLAGPSTSSAPTTKQSVIGLKPSTAAVQKGTENIGSWTREQMEATLKQYPQLKKDFVQLTQQMSFEQFKEHLISSKSSSAAPQKESSCTLEEARKTYANLLDKEGIHILHTLNTHQGISSGMATFKASMLRKSSLSSLGEKAVLFMDFHDESSAFNPHIEFGVQSKLKDSPIHLLAYIDDAMKKYFGKYGRTDRLIRYYVRKEPVLEQVTRLPEYTEMGKQFTLKEKEVQSLLQKENSGVKAVVGGGASSSKAVLKQPQLNAVQLQMQQMLQQQPEKGMAALFASQNASQIQAFLSVLQGQAANAQTTAQSTAMMATLQQIMALQQQAQQVQQEKAKKAKEEEEKRAAITKAKAEEAEKRKKEKEEEAEKRRKEKEEQIALKKAQKEEEKRLEKERKQREAEEERRRKEEEKAKKIEEERQRRMREEEEKERRRREEIERKMREEAEKKRLEEELAQKREQLRIKQEEDKRQREEEERQRQLREEEERAARVIEEDLTMDLEEMEGVPRPLTQFEEVEVQEEEAARRERQQQLDAARQAALNRSSSMSGQVKQESLYHELNNFFLDGSSGSTVGGPGGSNQIPQQSQGCYVDQKGPMLQQSPMGMQQQQQHSSPSMQNNILPHQSVSSQLLQNGGQYGQISSNPPTPQQQFGGSPYVSHQSPLAGLGGASNAGLSPLMNGSPSASQQMMMMPKSEGGSVSGLQRANSFSSSMTVPMHHGNGSPMQQQPQHSRANSISSGGSQRGNGSPMLQQSQMQHNFFANQIQSPTNGVQQSQPSMQQVQPVMQQQPQPMMQQQPQQSSYQQHPMSMQMQQVQQQQIPSTGMAWHQPQMQQPSQATPHLQQPQHSMMQPIRMQLQQPSRMQLQQQQQTMQLQQQQIQMQSQQQQQHLQQEKQRKAAADQERQRKLRELQQQMSQQQREMAMMHVREGGVAAGVQSQMNQMPSFASQHMQQQSMQQTLPQQQMNPQHARQMALFNQQNGQISTSRPQQNQSNNMNRYY